MSAPLTLYHDVDIVLNTGGHNTRLTPCRVAYHIRDEMPSTMYFAGREAYDELKTLDKLLWDVERSGEYTTIDRGYDPHARGNIVELHFSIPTYMPAENLKWRLEVALRIYKRVEVTVTTQLR